MAKRLIKYLLAVCLVVSGCVAFGSCGRTRTYWGIENEYNYDGNHHKPKYGKHKKHKKNKHHHDKHHHCHD